mgnify:CR=1 FL=1
MSRTYRRKNAWQEKNYVDVDFVKYTNRYVVNVSYYKKYENQPDDAVHKRLKTWYHSDCLKYWSEGAFKKEHARNKLRAKNKQEIIRALKTGEEENLQLTTQRELFGEWWYYN